MSQAPQYIGERFDQATSNLVEKVIKLAFSKRNTIESK